MSAAARHAREVAALRQQVEELRSTIANMVRVGPVAEVDAQKGYRLKLGEDSGGEPYLSPWLPHPETGKTSVPLRKGQIVGQISPNGDARQGFVLRGGYGGDHKTPNTNMDANVFEDAGVRIEIANAALRIEAGGVTFTLSGKGVEIEGGRVKHDSRNIGSSHVHGGVRRGNERTDPPD